MGSVIQERQRRDPATLIGRGKVEDVARLSERARRRRGRLRRRADPRPAAQPRGGGRPQDPGPHAADPRHLRPARAHAARAGCRWSWRSSTTCCRGWPARACCSRGWAAASGRADPARRSWRPTAGASASASSPCSARSSSVRREPAHPPGGPPAEPGPGGGAGRLHERGQVHAVQRPHPADAGGLGPALHDPRPAGAADARGRRARTCCWSTPSASSRSCPTRWWPPSGPRSRRWCRPTCCCTSWTPPPRTSRSGRRRWRPCSRRSAPGSGPACLVLNKTDRDARARGRGPAGRAAGLGAGLGPHRRGPARACAERHGAAAWSSLPRSVRLRFAAGDARGIAGVYTAGRVTRPRGRGRRGAARRGDPGAPARAVPGAPGLRRALRRGLARWPRSRGRGLRAAALAPRLPRGRRLRVSRLAGRGELRPATRRGEIEKAWQDVLAGDGRGARRSGCSKLLRRKPGPRARRDGPRPTPGCAAGRLDEARHAASPAVLAAPAGGRVRAGRRGGRGLRAGATARPRWPLPAARGRVAPDDALVRRRLAELRLQVTERRVAAAAGGAAGGRHRPGHRGRTGPRSRRPRRWRASGWSWRDLLVGRGRRGAAAAGSWRRIPGRTAGPAAPGRVLVGQQEHTRALEAYRRVLARDPRDEEALRRSREAREALELLQMPEEYRRIPGAEPITRADLAALVSSRSRRWPRVPAGRRQGGHRHLGLLGAGPHHPGAGPGHHRRLPEPHVPAGGHRPPGRPGPGRAAGARPPALPGHARPAPHRHVPEQPATTTRRRGWWRRGSWT